MLKPRIEYLLVVLVLVSLGFMVTWMLQSKKNVQIIENNKNEAPIAVAKTSQQSACPVTIIMPTMARGETKSFHYLQQTLTRLVEASTYFFQPCVRIFHMRAAVDEEAVQNLDATVAAFANDKIRVTHVHKQVSGMGNRFSRSGLKENQAQQSDDVYDMLERAQEYCSADNLFMMMEDDFLLCNGSEYQMARILEEARQLQGKFSGFRMSHGLNGILYPCADVPILLKYMERNANVKLPIDWLLENWWNMNNLRDTSFHHYATVDFTGTRHFRQFYMYKYQLFVHIGMQSTMQHTWVVPHSKCHERIIYTRLGREFDMHRCVNSLFSPCNSEEIVPITPDVNNNDAFHLPLFNTVHTLDDLHRVSAEQCTTSCTECCKQKQKQCKPEYLPYINRCDMFKHKWATCQMESIALSTAPTVIDNVFYSISRYARFLCDANPRDGETRICPCA